MGFDFVGITEQGERKTYFNGMVAGFFAFEFSNVSPGQSCLVFLSYQPNSFSKVPFSVGDSKANYAEKFKKAKQESSFRQKEKSALLIKNLV